MAVEWLEVIVLVLALAAASWVFGVLIRWVGTTEWQAADLFRRLGRKEASVPRRPIEQAARDLRRRRMRFHQPSPGTSRAKIEAARYAYDHALGEVATAVGVEHLLDVLDPGDELDAERSRVENRLWLAGVRFEESA